jgi:dipeptidyl aminopeptidase/acylaminoacyl peptidase
VIARILVLIVAAGCTGVPHSTPAEPCASPAPEVIASSAGSSAPWPAATLVPAPTLRTQTRPLPHDLAQLRALRGVTISRDGARVAYVVRSPSFDPGAKPSPDDTKGGWKVEQQLFVVDRAGGAPRQLTFGEDPVNAPRFSPDGQSLAFVRQGSGKAGGKNAGKPALHVLPLGGGEPRVVPLGDYELQGFDWAPDGKAFVFTATQPLTEERKAERWRRGGARVYDREWEQVHLFVVPLAGGEPRHINRGTDTVVSYAWSPDGQRIALVVASSSEPVLAGTFHKLVVVSAADGGNAQQLDQGDGQGDDKTPFIIRQVAWSPDSRQLAYSVTARGGLSHIDELRVRTLDGSRVIDAAATLDLELTGFAWAGDGRSLIASATVRTLTKLYRLSLDGHGAKEIAIGKHVLSGLEGDRAGRYLVTAASTPVRPADPTVIDVERGTVTPATSINPQLADWTIARNEVVTWKNHEGVALEGILTVTGEAKGGAPPLIVIPHGGPDWVSLEGFSAWAQFFAARGYSVFEPNYRGGLGYGRPFYEANRGRLGEIELADIESGVDALISAGKADRARLFYGGWSWGGYLSAWTLGHTDRYRAFMVGAGVVDVVVQYVTSDINHGVTADWEYKGRPWGQPEAFERANPSRSLAHARAPTLIFHGESDERVPFVNAQILYRALHDRGVPVTFWAYPREPHGFQEPAHVQHLMETWAAFFDEQLAAK